MLESNEKKGAVLAIFNKVSIFINPVSGGGIGEKVYREIQELRKKNQIIEASVIAVEKTDLDDTDKIKTAVNHSDLIIIFGGDGTVHQIVNLIMPLSYKKGISLFPLGTGNDLARSLGFKKKTVGEFLETVTKSPKKKELNIYRLNDKVFFTNYISFGFDAGLVDKYENAVNPETGKKMQKKSRIQKLLLWTAIGLGGFLSSQKKLEIEGKKDPLLSIIFNGIKSYGGGAVFSCDEPDDGCIKSMFITSKLSFLKVLLNRSIMGFVPFNLKTQKIKLPHKISFSSPPDVQMDGDSYSKKFSETTNFKIELAGKLEIFG